MEVVRLPKTGRRAWDKGEEVKEMSLWIAHRACTASPSACGFSSITFVNLRLYLFVCVCVFKSLSTLREKGFSPDRKLYL